MYEDLEGEVLSGSSGLFIKSAFSFLPSMRAPTGGASSVMPNAVG